MTTPAHRSVEPERRSALTPAEKAAREAALAAAPKKVLPSDPDPDPIPAAPKPAAAESPKTPRARSASDASGSV